MPDLAALRTTSLPPGVPLAHLPELLGRRVLCIGLHRLRQHARARDSMKPRYICDTSLRRPFLFLSGHGLGLLLRDYQGLGEVDTDGARRIQGIGAWDLSGRAGCLAPGSDNE